MKVERLPAEAKREDESRGADFDDDAKEDVPRHYVRKIEIRREDQWNQQRCEQQRDDAGAPRQLRKLRR